MNDLPPEGLTRRRLLLYGGGAALAAALPAAWPRRAAAADIDPGVPTFESVYGRTLGPTQASFMELDTYVQLLAKASPRVKTELLPGRSLEGRPMRLVLISSAANLANLDDIEARTRALRLRPPTAAVRAKEVAALPALINILANVHGNEPSGGDALAMLAYELAARTDAANVMRLDQVVTALVLVQNPDGRENSRRTNDNLFDLNRDWFAFTQPETPGKLALYSRRPPVIGIDMHEQFATAPNTFFFPPDNDPAHHESSLSGLDAADKVVTPAIEAAFTAKGYTFDHYGAYDVFFPGYGDISPNQVWGGAGVLFEVENSSPYAEKVARQFTGADAAVDVAAAHRQDLLAAWAAQWPEATAQGAAGTLAPNFVVNPASPKAIPVPDEKVYGYALRTSRHAADVAHLVDRLRTFDCEVHVTTRPVSLSLRPFGGSRFAESTLGRGTIIVSCAQPMKHWIHILLADDPFAAVNSFYDVSGWSNPAMMGLNGGAIGEPIAGLLKRPKRKRNQHGELVGKQRKATLRAVDRAADLQPARLKTAPVYAFALDAALAQVAAFSLMADGVALRRATAAVDGLPAGAAIVDGAAREKLIAAGKRYGIRVRGLSTAPGGLIALRRPKVQVLHDAGGDSSALLFAASNGFASWLTRDRFGLDTTRVTTDQIEAGSLANCDVFIVPDGLTTVIPGSYSGIGSPNVSASGPGGGLTPVGLANVQAFVARGGVFIGYRALGVAVATGAGIAGDLSTIQPPTDFSVPGLPVRMELVGGDTLTRGLGGEAYAFNVSDPILQGGGTTLARYPKGDGARQLGYATGLAALEGTVAATVVTVGAGRSYVMSFDPAYRGYVETTQRMLGNVLLEAPGAVAGARGAADAAGSREAGAASARAAADAGAANAHAADSRATASGGLPRGARPVGAATAPIVHAGRPQLVRVAAAHEAVLRRLVAATEGVPADALVMALDGELVQVCAADPDPLSGHTAPWVGRLLAALRKADVHPELVIA